MDLQVILPQPMPPGLVTPLQLPNNAALYSLDGAASDATYIKDGSNRLQLIADRSGNSAVNLINFDGTLGTTIANVPSFAAGDFTYVAWIYPTSVATRWSIFGATNGARMEIGRVSGGISIVDTLNNAVALNGTGGVLTANTWQMIAVTRTSGNLALSVNTTACGSGANATNYTGNTISLGRRETGTGDDVFTGNIQNAYIFTRALSGAELTALYSDGTVPSGNCVLNAGIAGTSKLASTVTDLSGNSSTITMPATGAWVSGARDLVQLTQAKQPIWSTGSDGKNLATFDGSNDFMKAAPFSLSQPETYYMVFKPITWGLNKYIFDGGTNDTGFYYSPSTPSYRIFAGSEPSAATNSSLAVGTLGVATVVFNTTASGIAINRGAITVGNAGSNNAGGFTLASGYAGTGAYGNFTFSEALLRSVADDAATQARIVTYEASKWGVTL